jgi:hypothetical protein
MLRWIDYRSALPIKGSIVLVHIYDTVYGSEDDIYPAICDYEKFKKHDDIPIDLYWKIYNPFQKEDDPLRTIYFDDNNSQVITHWTLCPSLSYPYWKPIFSYPHGSIANILIYLKDTILKHDICITGFKFKYEDFLAEENRYEPLCWTIINTPKGFKK